MIADRPNNLIVTTNMPPWAQAPNSAYAPLVGVNYSPYVTSAELKALEKRIMALEASLKAQVYSDNSRLNTTQDELGNELY